MKKLSLIAALPLLLAGCGSDNSNVPAAEQRPPEPAPPPVIDAFVVTVSTVVAAAAPDQSEPVKVDAMAPTAPENSDPSAL